MELSLSEAMNFLLALATIGSAAIAVDQYFKARTSDRRLLEVEKALTSHQYLKDRAMNEYRNGRFRACFDTLQKYYAGNDDSNDLHQTINIIFWAETHKIYGDFLGKTANIPILLFTQYYYLDKDKEQRPQRSYPKIVEKLLSLYKKKFGHDLPYYSLPVCIASESYGQALGFIDSYEASGQEFSGELAPLIRARCQAKLAKNTAQQSI